jgi:hypothetical protein
MSEKKSKVCNICHVEKLLEDFNINQRRCKCCQYEKNKAYSKTYYQQNKERLIQMNINNYKTKIKCMSSVPVGRPRKHQQSEGIELSK